MRWNLNGDFGSSADDANPTGAGVAGEDSVEEWPLEEEEEVEEVEDSSAETMQVGMAYGTRGRGRSMCFTTTAVCSVGGEQREELTNQNRGFTWGRHSRPREFEFQKGNQNGVLYFFILKSIVA